MQRHYWGARQMKDHRMLLLGLETRFCDRARRAVLTREERRTVGLQ